MLKIVFITFLRNRNSINKILEEGKAMKLSMYNHHFKNDKGYYIYNANTNALLELGEKDFQEILKLKEYGVI